KKIKANIIKAKLLEYAIKDKNSLNKFWNSWLTIVKALADKFIPATYICPRTFHANLFKATRLHQALKLANKIQQIYMLSDLEYQTIDVQDMYTNKFNTIFGELKQVQQTLLKARTLENCKNKRDIINRYIIKKYNNFANNTTRIIDSILERHTDAVAYNNIRTPSRIVTKTENIKKATRLHFCSWTKLTQ
ncbi:7688_t:CDS:2, partial [Gigaspora margarita]